MTRIGLQAMMLKDRFAEVGAYEALKAAREVGYTAFEISQIPMTPHNVAGMRRAREELGVDIAALTAMLTSRPGSPFESLATDLDKVIADARALGADKIRIPMLSFDAVGSRDGVVAFARQCEEIAKRLEDVGISLAYHNHHIDFVTFDRSRQIDIILEESPRLEFELDVHWSYRGGVDPLEMLRRYGARVTLLHLRDYRVGHVPQSALAAAARGDIAEFYAGFIGVVQDSEVGEGSLDFRAIVDTAVAGGVQWMFVEQEDLFGRDPLACAETSLRNLTRLGYGDLCARP
ncbi:sugar phosphate isomerase/epimerase family protein [Dactylosporangium sp. CA-233914]|uniref:sugar phosphate isomerase/epimerase family protein n=1 Tax=Dactylosporangium sp. CA-233914 TaxID=3239934 RepID=UPI003D90C401